MYPQSRAGNHMYIIANMIRKILPGFSRIIAQKVLDNGIIEENW